MITLTEFTKAKEVIAQYYREQQEKRDNEMSERECLICMKKFKTSTDIKICPSCYV